MDRLVLRFRRTEPGAAFAAAWTTSRIIRDLASEYLIAVPQKREKDEAPAPCELILFPYFP